MKFEVLKQSHLKRNILIGIAVIVILITIILTFTRAKYRVTESIPLVSGTINYTPYDLNVIAMYQENESGEYESISTVPSRGYALNKERTYCEVNGEKDDVISIEYKNGIVNIGVTQKGTKCYLYFEISIEASNIIEDIYPDRQDILVYDDYNNLRYFGANPDNYVYFNCDDYNNPSSSTCELWRIIGVFNEDTHEVSGEKLVKIIRNDSIGSFAWNTSGNNNWTTASLQKSLNEDYLEGNTLGNGKGITEETRKMIETITWKLGGRESDATTSEYYQTERGTGAYNGMPTEWSGKIALMYPSDYGYATSGGSTTNRKTCLETNLDDWSLSDISDCRNNNWLFDGNSQWLLTPRSAAGSYAYTLRSTGNVYNINFTDMTFVIYPSLYLTYAVSISGGTGSASDPFTLKL